MAATLPARLAAVQRVPADSLHLSRPTWWLESRFHFSFAEYVDPQRNNFGALRVMNDDLVQGRTGFGRHPHRDAEIFSYVLEGQLSHADSTGARESLGRGCVQFMSAGTGVTHSEMNEHDETCRFIQVWLTPDRRGHAPMYGSARYDRADRHNRLLQLLRGTRAPPDWPGVVRRPECIALHQDANVFVCEADAGAAHDVALGASRQAYLLCAEGAMHVNGEALAARDAARIRGEVAAATTLSLRAGEPGAHLLLIEMALAAQDE